MNSSPARLKKTDVNTKFNLVTFKIHPGIKTRIADPTSEKNGFNPPKKTLNNVFSQYLLIKLS